MTDVSQSTTTIGPSTDGHSKLCTKLRDAISREVTETSAIDVSKHEELTPEEICLDDHTVSVLRQAFSISERIPCNASSERDLIRHLIESIHRVNREPLHRSTLQSEIEVNDHAVHISRFLQVCNLVQVKKSVDQQGCTKASKPTKSCCHRFWPVQRSLRPLPPPASAASTKRKMYIAKLSSKKPTKRQRHRLLAFYITLSYLNVKEFCYMTELVCSGFVLACKTKLGCAKVSACWAVLSSKNFHLRSCANTKEKFFKLWVRSHTIIGGPTTTKLSQLSYSPVTSCVGRAIAKGYATVTVPRMILVSSSYFGGVPLLERNSSSLKGAFEWVSAAVFSYAKAIAPCVVIIEAQVDQNVEHKAHVFNLRSHLDELALVRCIMNDRSSLTDRNVLAVFK